MAARPASHTSTETSAELDELLSLVRPHGQEHLFAWWDRLSPSERTQLASQVRSVDFARVERLLHAKRTTEDWEALSRRAEGPPAVRLRGPNPFSAADAARCGRAALAAGRVALVLVAGGQGTRLGFDHPKGLYPIGPISQASLFQILIEKLVAVGQRHQRAIPLYLMTSPATRQETTDFLTSHDRFGLPEADLSLFCQGTMPALDSASGRVLLEAPGSLALSPDGHGGLVAALDACGAMADMRRRGIEQLFYVQVDNPLAAVCDAEFIGYHLLARSELSTQVVAKRTPADRVGNVVSIDGQVRTIEYSDLPAEAGEQRLADGSLKLWAGNIAVHVFDRSLLERTAADGGGLPFHVANKKVPYLNDEGRLVEPATENAIKFEQFIFDLLPAARNPLVVEVDEATHFAPLKNKPGEKRDTHEHVQTAMIALAADWLAKAGAHVAPEVPVEISPLFALDAAELAARIGPGLSVATATYFR
ncbi:MAG TPA: UDPGP type 1 family protein [Pirellulales bacterium]|jgi:UDP-N-acetylglucosamine/UDP-N-acetylgalactosamine diphosphorylase|nr:UDPGP type 1 family protein [Pirellulales bacterium]